MRERGGDFVETMIIGGEVKQEGGGVGIVFYNEG